MVLLVAMGVDCSVFGCLVGGLLVVLFSLLGF